jgi:ribosome-associated toxin RatA of RatAB toxin-antitoxin module
MKDLSGSATAITQASSVKALALLEAVDRYPDWYPDVVKQVDVLERDAGGHPSKVQTKLHVQYGPLSHDFDLVMNVEIDPPSLVRMSRVPHHHADDERFDVTWHLDGSEAARLRVELLASLNVPRFLPLGDVGNSLAAGFVNAAANALKQS